jgi:hypothetical protein
VHRVIFAFARQMAPRDLLAAPVGADAADDPLRRDPLPANSPGVQWYLRLALHKRPVLSIEVTES